MTLAQYALGLVALAGLVLPAAVAARSVRRRWWPEVDAATARLVEVVVVLAQLYVVAYLLGTIGWFRRWPVVLGAVVLGATLTRLSHGPAGASADASPPVRSTRPRLGTALAGVAASVVLVRYLAQAVVALHRGIYDGDSLWYHAPFAARFLQEGSITGLHFAGGERLIPYYPANGELAGALSMLPFQRDFLLPLLNVGWAALALLAAWCLGQRYGRGALGVAGVALALAVPTMASTQGGSAANDVVGVALLLAAIALLVRADGSSRWYLLSGVAAGLAFGVKFSLFLPVAACGVAVLALTVAERRPRLAMWWATAFALPAAYWLLRNWAQAGNPVPWTDLQLGPIALDAVPLPESAVHGSTVVHYAGRIGAWAHVFSPGLRMAFGPSWPIVLGLAVFGVLSIALGRDGRGRTVAAIGAVGLGLYFVTPNAAGIRAMPYEFATTTFVLNLRYGIPALAVALVSLSASRLFRDTRAATSMTGVLVALVVATQVPRELQHARPEWLVPTTDVLLACAVALAIGLAAALLRRARWHPGATLVAVTVGAIVAFPAQSAAEDRRYRPRPDAPISGAFAWARTVSGQRIAVSGDVRQYPFYGRGLDNHVQFVSVARDDGTFDVPRTCASWRRALSEGRYDYVVVVPPSFGTDAGRDTEEDWLDGEPNAWPVRRDDASRVWRLRGRLDPARCGSKTTERG
jgi:hypothetical protein